MSNSLVAKLHAVVLAGLVVLLFASPCPAAQPQPFAPTRGLCVVVGQTPTDLVINLAKSPDLTVYVQCANATQAAELRQAAHQAGLLNQRLYVSWNNPPRIGLADNLADTLLCQGAWPEQELLRVLRPGGKAIVGDRQLIKPVPTGTDSWSHPYHGPDNNPLSSDQLAREPYLTQFLAEPLFSSQPEVTVAAGGRVFKAFGHMTFRAYQNASINTLFALNGYNGTQLWKRDLKPGFMIHRNTMIATPDGLYMADDESCKLYDGDTGQIKDQIVAPPEFAEGPVWKWMALENGVLYALVGPKEVPAPVAKGTDTRIGGWPWGMWPGYEYQDPKTAWGFGKTFLAIDIKTKKLLWHFREAEPLDSRGLCLKNGRIYYYCPDKFLGCIDASNGRQVWRTSDATLLAAIGPNEKAQHYMTGFSTSTYMKATDKVLMFAGSQRSALVAASVDDGKLLWRKKDGNFQLVLQPNAIYALGQQGGRSYKLDYSTGNVLAEFIGRRACTRATGTVDSVFCRGIEGTYRWDLATDALTHISPMRPACHDGVVVSDGLLYWGPWICGCHLTLVGAICLTPAGQFDFAAQADESRQLQTYAADPAQVQAFTVAPSDWPTFMANNQRRAATHAAVPDATAIRWEYKPASVVTPTAPVAAGGLVFVGGSDGVMRALDASTGQLKWEALSGGSIFFPPAISKNRGYFGSNDGGVYAFEAATGRLLWRFQCAPTERRIAAYGELVSTWPVAGGVVADDGAVYAAAGISHFDGTHVYSLDAVTGKIKWHNNSSGVVDPKVKNGISLTGPLKLENGLLTFPGGNVYVTATYDAKSGKCSNQPAGPNTKTRIFLWPRKLWEPIDADERATAEGVLRLKPARRGGSVGLYAAGSDKPKWSVNVYGYQGCAVGANAVVTLAKTSENEEGKPAPWRVTAIRLTDGAVMWSQALPGAPVHWGVAIDSQNRILVSLEDGRLVCFGSL